MGVNILELANKTQTLYEHATTEERQKLLGDVLSNSTIEDKKPFDIIAERACCSD